MGKQNIQRLGGKFSEQVSSEFAFCHLPTRRNYSKYHMQGLQVVFHNDRLELRKKQK